ncbi:hypothetical protein HX049_02510 [Myroides odoratimimus]|uniref:hypothetical protein n=1 Tax=Myroides odoratimimus TaxID=76832 RepID=UPI002576A3DC|nr:hypothetical protein [Myroides odoratimimus]MDM1396052.1 hypothetical protein [Myroides odoratimimus]
MKNQKINIKEVFKDIESKVQILKEDYSIKDESVCELQDKIEVVNNDFSNLQRKYNQLVNFIIAVIIVFTVASVYFQYTFDKKIDKISDGYGLTKFDSIKRTILPISNEIDSITKKGYQVISYETRKGNIVTYSDLIDQRDSIKSDLTASIDTLKLTNSKLRKELENKDIVLKLIKGYYEVDYSITKNKNSYTMSVFSPKIDSTFVLYDIFRHRLFFDEDTGYWYVKKEPGAPERIKYIK